MFLTPTAVSVLGDVTATSKAETSTVPWNPALLLADRVNENEPPTDASTLQYLLLKNRNPNSHLGDYSHTRWADDVKCRRQHWMAIMVPALVSGVLSLGPGSVLPLPTTRSWLSQSLKQLSPVLFCFCSTIQISVGLYLTFFYWVRTWSSNLWVLMEPKPHPRKPSHAV